ncbi:hypothetical protein COMNV_01305 [Commensalibacter sp. Nvir]|uniref:c-type cytochrome n=1 Tax=Commensalibacter sp. Nvir TaxID=3069817 RepID=UPI002D38051C|nr:hypothetical protein COMNV_01305 [Commensalibacter sp. Nvir]
MDYFDWNRLFIAGVFSICFLYAAWGISHFMVPDTTPIKPIILMDSNEDGPLDFSSANIKEGEEFSQRHCAICHTFTPNDQKLIGPGLYGIMKRNIASLPTFHFTESLSKHNKENWTPARLNIWLKRPTAFASETNMAYAGALNKYDRINVIAFLNSLSSRPDNLSKIKTLENNNIRPNTSLEHKNKTK